MTLDGNHSSRTDYAPNDGYLGGFVIAVTRTARGVIIAYLTTSALFASAASLIWGVNTLFLMAAGLDILEVMLVNTAFTVGQILFEVPTGVIADTIGRKASFMLGNLTLVVSTLLYVASSQYRWGIWAFVGASVLIGLGFTFQTGAVDAWLVDALDHTGYKGTRERVFSWGGMVFGTSMLIGTLAGGFLAQIDLAWPYVVRAVLLLGCLIAAGVMMEDLGFQKRPLRRATFGAETRAILEAGVTFGWNNRVVRPLMFVSLAIGFSAMYTFYAWQRYALDLLGTDLIWVVGVLTAISSLAGIAGNALVRQVMREGARRRDPARVLSVAMVVSAVLMAGVGAVGLLTHTPGVVPMLVAATLWTLWSVVFGIAGPVRQAYLNAQVPSAQRATVLSLDALFGDVGGSAGQPLLGWIAKMWSIPLGIIIGAAFLAVGAPLYRAAGRGEVRAWPTSE
ncbi:MAG: MFS transporter [Actinomycetota bacterium]|nr:MAG: major facilitator superfamily [Actinomycetota bacterium]MDO8950037.1 MFS transporter [Actinomycetota bacterium]MDP3629613.1 MFS transporter [Actinomycetota bacterium]